VRIPCPTCGRKGTVDKRFGPGVSMGYYNPNTGDTWPQETCQSCMGSGWVNDGTPIKTDAEVQIGSFTSDRASKP
jgi:hypothetical protein